MKLDAKAKAERLEILADYIAEELAGSFRVLADTSRKGHKALWCDRETNKLYISGDGAPDTQWDSLEEAIDAFDNFKPTQRTLKL